MSINKKTSIGSDHRPTSDYTVPYIITFVMLSFPKGNVLKKIRNEPVQIH